MDPAPQHRPPPYRHGDVGRHVLQDGRGRTGQVVVRQDEVVGGLVVLRVRTTQGICGRLKQRFGRFY